MINTILLVKYNIRVCVVCVVVVICEEDSTGSHNHTQQRKNKTNKLE